MEILFFDRWIKLATCWWCCCLICLIFMEFNLYLFCLVITNMLVHMRQLNFMIFFDCLGVSGWQIIHMPFLYCTIFIQMSFGCEHCLCELLGLATRWSKVGNLSLPSLFLEINNMSKVQEFYIYIYIYIFFFFFSFHSCFVCLLNFCLENGCYV